MGRQNAMNRTFEQVEPMLEGSGTSALDLMEAGPWTSALAGMSSSMMTN
jgi:hypothetical protein